MAHAEGSPTARMMDSGTPLESGADSASPGVRLSSFAKWCWFMTAYMIAVILFGAWVRITGSGAGCGRHWPSCQGEVVPRAPSLETVIEFSHRVTSGALGLLVFGLCIGAWKTQAPTVRRYMLLTALFVIIESALGAGLVKAELVANDASVARAIVVGLHLCNTLLLTASSALAAWHASFESPSGLPRGLRRFGFWVGVALMIVCATGAVTALGDTIFPKGSEQAVWQADHAHHFLVRLRSVHPILALVSGFLIVGFARMSSRQPGRPLEQRLCLVLELLVWGQLAVGAFSILLGAPGWMQLVHLLWAQLVWLCFVVLWWPRAGRSAIQSRLPVSS